MAKIVPLDPAEPWPPTDDLLVARYQAEKCPNALEELFQRFEARAAKFITHLARQHGLPSAEWPDAIREWPLALLKALAKFPLAAKENQANPPSFARYLKTALRFKFLNYFRDWKRFEGRLDRSRTAALVLDNDALAGTRSGNQLHSACFSLDPAILTQQQELRERLNTALGRLKQSDRWLLKQRLAGVPVTAIARARRKRTTLIRRRIHRLIARLRFLLRNCADGSALFSLTDLDF
jgi:RNA polymerase sigma factor (sigma-70 family)